MLRKTSGRHKYTEAKLACVCTSRLQFRGWQAGAAPARLSCVRDRGSAATLIMAFSARFCAVQERQYTAPRKLYLQRLAVL